MLHFYSKSSKIFQGMKYTFICTLDAKSIKFNVWHQQLVSKTILQLLIIPLSKDGGVDKLKVGRSRSKSN